MKKIKEFMESSITWGDYLKLCLICGVAATATTLGYAAYLKITDCIESKRSKTDVYQESEKF
jgi:hypothetical protein